MRALIGFAAAALLAATAAPADAQQKKQRNYERYERYDRYDRDWRDFGILHLFPGYGARNPDNFKFGSDKWWKAMDREGRGGHPRL